MLVTFIFIYSSFTLKNRHAHRDKWSVGLPNRTSEFVFGETCQSSIVRSSISALVSAQNFVCFFWTVWKWCVLTYLTSLWSIWMSRNDIGYNKYKTDVVKDVIYVQAKVRKRSYWRKSREKIMLFLTKLATSSKERADKADLLVFSHLSVLPWVDLLNICC